MAAWNIFPMYPLQVGGSSGRLRGDKQGCTGRCPKWTLLEQVSSGYSLTCQ